MFSVRRYDPAASEPKPEPYQLKKVPQDGDTLDALSRLTARLEAKKKDLSATPENVIETTNQLPHSICQTQDSIPNIDPLQPITRKQKARIELGLTGANSIPLSSLEGPKPKTKAKQKYLKRKKQRLQARKKGNSQGDKIKQDTRDQSIGKDDRSHSQDAAESTPKPDDISIKSWQLSPGLVEKHLAKSINLDEETKLRKRPKNLDLTLQSIAKKRKVKDSKKVIGPEQARENIEKASFEHDAITQPGALPRFPAPVNPSSPNTKLLQRFAMGMGELDPDEKDEENGMVQIDSQSELDLSKIKLRGESLECNEAWRISPHSLQRLRELKIRSLLAVQMAVFSIVLPPLGSNLHTPATLLHPNRYPSRDICVSAPTGSGKTLSYIIPIVELLSSRVVVRLRALIVLPTRDLVLQVKATFDSFAQGTGLKSTIVTGQHSISQEQSLLSNSRPNSESAVDVVIATPGRLLDHLNHTPGFSLEHLCFLVLDEADQLLSRSQLWLHQILSQRSTAAQSGQFPKQVQLPDPKNLDALHSTDLSWSTALNQWSLPLESVNPCKSRPFRILLFSATLRRDPTKLSHLGLRQPIFVKISKSFSESPVQESIAYTLPSTLEQHMVVTTTTLKPIVFFHLIKSQKIRRALCFCKSVEGANRLAGLYRFMVEACDADEGHQASAEELGKAACFSSDLKAGDRKKLLLEFQAGDVNILICSDVIARGLDIPSVQYVINYDSPVDAKKYVHRVGRTARAGEFGTAWSLVESQEAKFLKSSLKAAMGEKVCESIKKSRVNRNHLSYLMPVYEVWTFSLKSSLLHLWK